MNERKKCEIVVDGEVFIANGINWDYPQTDSESSGPTDDNVMYRDVLPRRVKFGIIIEKPSESIAAKFLRMRKKESCEVNYYDLEQEKRVTRIMYPTCDAVNALCLFLENGEEKFQCDSFEIRFTQMIPDEFSNLD